MSTTPAGYSGTPLPRKLGIKPGHKLLLLGAPERFAEETLGALPEDVAIGRRAAGKADVLVSFHTERRDLERRIPPLRERMGPNGRLWIAWPKKSAKVQTDITENVVRDIALANALVDNKVAAISEIWSGLQLVIRVKDRLP